MASATKDWLKRNVPHAGMAVGVAALAAAMRGLGLEVPADDGTVDVTTLPTILTSLAGFATALRLYSGAASAAPLDSQGKQSARFTLTIAMQQACQQNDPEGQSIVAALAPFFEAKPQSPAGHAPAGGSTS